MKDIQVKNLVKVYKTHKKPKGLTGSIKSFFKRKYIEVNALREISFDMQKGELVGFIGPNGAGKTTTLKILSGLLYPTQGEIQVIGYNPWERRKKFLQQISLVMGQKNQLWWDLPAQESFFLNKEIYQIPTSQFKKTLTNLVEMLEFEELLEIPVRKLSLGERMKAEIIAALIHSPKVLFLDEPTIGLDVVMQERIREFIKGYNKKFNTTIILTSHYMEDVKELCKRVIMIDNGSIVFDGSLKNLINKYAKNKVFEIILEKEVPKKHIEAIGEIKNIEYPRVVISVPREHVKNKAIQMFSTLPIEDLTIQEPDLAEIVRIFFKNNTTN